MKKSGPSLGANMNDAWEVRARRIVYSARPFFEVAVERSGSRRAIVDNYHQIEAGTCAAIVAETADGKFLLLPAI